MSDTRSRHAPCCCDAIREADRADDLTTPTGKRLCEPQTFLDDDGPGFVTVDIDPATIAAIEAEARQQAEAALAEWKRRAAEFRDVADAARADAERLAGAMDHAGIPACFPTSGGTDGVWCVTHDTPMDETERCEARVAWDAALAAHDALTRPDSSPERTSSRQKARAVHLREHAEDESDPGEWCARCGELDEPKEKRHA
jgi:hypothetical protein